MNNTKTIIIVLSIIIVALIGYIAALHTSLKPQDTLAVIKERKSVRHYEQKEVAEKDINTILTAAMAAPTAGNKQPWEFIVIKNREKLDNLAEYLPHGKFLKNAPLAIIVAGNMDRAFTGEEKDLWVQDTSAATENLLLAAEAIGLGAVWTAVYPMQDRVKNVSEFLNLPQNVIPLNVIIIGYPAGAETPKDKTKFEYVHYEKY